MTENKTVQNYSSIQQAARDLIPEEVREKLDNAADSKEIMAILSDNGITPETFNEQFAALGYTRKNIGLAIPDEGLEGITGGFNDSDAASEVYCRNCGARDRKSFTYHPFASAFAPGVYSIYTCDICGCVIQINKPSGSILHFSKDTCPYEDLLW